MTAKTIINVYNGTLTMEFGDHRVQFNLDDALRHPLEMDSISEEVLHEATCDMISVSMNGDEVVEHPNRDEVDFEEFSIYKKMKR